MASPPTWERGLEGQASELDDDRLGLEIGFDALAALFAADARFLVPAEGQGGVDQRVAIAPTPSPI